MSPAADAIKAALDVHDGPYVFVAGTALAAACRAVGAGHDTAVALLSVAEAAGDREMQVPRASLDALLAGVTDQP
jgi:hypothetical protein